MAEDILLDTSAIIAFLERELGADQVKTTLLDSSEKRIIVYGSFVTLTEVEYITTQERGEQIAEQRIADIRKLPIKWIHSDDVLCSAAAKLKAVHHISFADAFVAATAMRFDATLVHKNPEFLALAPTLKQLALPPK